MVTRGMEVPVDQAESSGPLQVVEAEVKGGIEAEVEVGSRQGSNLMAFMWENLV